VTHDDLTAAREVQELLEHAEEAVWDLANRMKRKGDIKRCLAIKVRAQSRIEDARHEIERVFA
jgi:hypothetical protein